MSDRPFVVALLLLVPVPGLAQRPESDAGAPDIAPDAGTSVPDQLCAVVDSDEDDVIDAKAGCVPPDVNVVLLPDWEAIMRGANERRAGRVATPREPTTAEPRWTVDFETVVGRSNLVMPGGIVPSGYSLVAVASSSLATIQFRPRLEPSQPLSFAVVVPFALGNVSNTGCCPGQTVLEVQGPYAQLGSIALAGTWESRAHSTRVPVGVLVALPTAVGGSLVSRAWSSTASPNQSSTVLRAELAEGMRGFEDRELFHPGFAVVPSIAVLHHFGPAQLSGSAKLALRVPVLPRPYGPTSALEFASAIQVMARAVDRPGAVVSGGVRFVAVVGAWEMESRPQTLVSLVVEPRVEARLGAIALRAGFTFPFTGSPLGLTWFPATWGVRAGVGYSF